MVKKLLVFCIFLLTPILIFASLEGDVNGDNKVNNMDYVLVRNHISKKSLLSSDKLKWADVNNDNKINNMDYVLIRNIIRKKVTNTTTPTPTQLSTIEIKSIKLNKTNISLSVGKSDTLVATITPSNAIDNNLTWSSSNENIVKVNNSGIIMAISKGKATISVKSKNNIIATCIVEVFDHVDLVLMWGQSNMVGRAGKYASEITIDNSLYLKNINNDILSNNKSYSRVIVNMPSNVAYEYKALSNSLLDINTNPTTFGEKLYYNNNTLSTSPANTIQDYIEKSSGTNMIPYFAKEYYERTNHKLVIVFAARGGTAIAQFLPTSRSKLYQTMVKKYQMAEKYLSDNNYIIDNKFYVVYQGEADLRENIVSVYERDYLKVHKGLINDLNLSFGAMVYMARGDMLYQKYLPALRNAQKKMVKENDSLIKGTDWPYIQLYEENNTSILCPDDNKLHLNAAALSQVGKQIAISIYNSNKIK